MLSSEEESIGESECFENVKSGKLIKKSRMRSKGTMISAVICVLILILPSIIVAYPPFWDDVYVDQLPYYHEWQDGPYDVTLYVKNVTENMTLSITFRKSSEIPESILYVDNESYGSIEVGKTIFSVPISTNVTLTFVASFMNITIVRVGDYGIINNTYDDVIVKGKTYVEEYQRHNASSGNDEGYRAIVSIPKDNRHSLKVYPIEGVEFSYMAITESGICNFSVISGMPASPDESIIPSGVEGIKISTNLSEHFKFEISYLEPEPPAFQTYPDLFVSSDDIVFSNNTPDEGDVIWINVTLYNIGEDDAEDCNVTAYLDLVETKTRIGDPVVIQLLAEGESATASFEWNTTDTFGNHIIRVLLDEDNLIEESNETNHASKNIFVDDLSVGDDSDNDGLPDFWEVKYGLDPDNNTGIHGANGDPDNDNFTNMQEYENITHPNSSDTDGDGLLDGLNNSLIELELKNMTLKNVDTPPPPEGDYYIMMSEYEIHSGAKFPYAGYRVPTNTSVYWDLIYNNTIYPNETLSVAYTIQNMPLNVYYRFSPDPISEFTITVDKEELEINKTRYIELNDTKFNLIVKATLLECNFSDPDPLCVDADWDGINDTTEIDYLSSRVLDFRNVDTDNDGLVNYLDVDSDNDNATDGIELDVYENPDHALLTCYPDIELTPQITDPLDPDTDDDGLLDGDEMFTYHSDPLSVDSDNDSLDDYYEAKTWFFYTNVTLEQAGFYDNKCKTTINIEKFIEGKYKARVYGTAQVKNETEQNVSSALNITLRSSTNTTLPYELVDELEFIGENLTEANISYSFEFEIYGNDAIEIQITANGSVFLRITDFRVYLNYTIFERLGTSLIDEDTDRDGLSDMEEIDDLNFGNESWHGLAPANEDTDFDHFWDGAELDYWDEVHDLRIEERVNRTKNPDFDGDKVLDGDEMIFGIDPTNADPDNDDINDYGELYQYVPMWRDELSQIFMGYCNESGSYKNGSLCRYFKIKERDSYMLKFVSLDTINRTLDHYNSSLLNDHDYLALVNNKFMNQSSIINVTRDGVLLDLDFGTNSMVVNKTIYGNYINITERRYFTVTARLGPSETNYSISYDINVTEENATVVLNFNQFVPSRQGLHPFKVDIDGDELPDGIEAKIGSNPWERHSDEDEINDFHEYNGTYGYKTNPAKEDTDGDGLWDGHNISGEGVVGELSLGTNSTNVDTDGDTLWDGYNISTHIGELSVNTDPLKADTDNDTMPDGWEVEYCLQPRNASDANDDADSDNLLNAQEYTVDTIPRDNDTDDDGIFDGDEILGVLFRTNIIKGAVSIENYGTQEGYKWIFYNGTDWKKYEYSNNSVETETQVTSNGSSQINPAIYGDLIVWQDDRNSSAGWDIYLYNLSSDEETRITTNVSNQTNPAIFGNYIVWQDDRNSSAGWDIYLYNISSGNETRITVNESDQKYPSIYSDIVVWMDERDGNSTNGWQKEIYMYNIKNEVEIRITNDTIEDDPEALLHNQTYPWIYESSVVWLDDKYNGSNVYLHQASGGKYLTNDSFEQKNPRMYGNIVVWEDYRNGNADIYTYDVLKDNITRITTNASNQTKPYVYGDNILWEDYRNGNADIYLFNITTSTTIQLTNNSENQTAPVAYIDRFVWVDDRNGNQDIYMYNFTHLVTLQDNSPMYYNNDNNEIYVWKADARYYRFNETSNAAVNTHYRPLNGYRYRELYEGPSPFDPDSDADGVYDGQEPYWNQDNDTDSKINALDTDSDGDGVPDGREVRVGYRTNADEGNYDAESWVAIDINVSDEVYVLKGFWYNASANDTNMGSYNFTLIESLTTPEGKNVSYNSTSEFIRIGFAPNASYFAANDSVAIKTQNYGQASYTENRQETAFVVDYSVDDDSIPNILDNDSDDDGILDGTEPLWYQDLDNDGYENMVDKDSDGDGLEDGTEDANYNGVVDDNETSTIDVDTDGDGIIDSVELNWSSDSDNDTLINACDMDSDNDGVTDGNEVRVVFRTNAVNGKYNSSSWVAVALNQSAWDPNSEPPYGYNLTGFWYNASSTGPTGIVLGYTFENDEIRYDEANETVYVNTTKFTINTSSQIIKSTKPTLMFTKHRKEAVVFYNISDGDNLYNVLDNDSDDDGLLDGLEDLDNDGVIDADETDPYWQDTDMDGLPDGLEDSDLNGSRNSGETDPLDVDSDDDGLWDGWKDLDDDSVYDPFEYGEDTNANGSVDVGETDPLLKDSDGDGLYDNEESINGTYWWEAEDYLASGADKITSENASTGSQIQIDMLEDGTYQMWVMAKSTIGGGNSLTFGVENSTSVTISSTTICLLNKYLWFNSSTFEISSSDLPITIKVPFSGANNSVYIDKILLIPISTSWLEVGIRVNDRYDVSYNQTSPAIAVEDEFVYFVWTDDRNGDFDIYLNIYNAITGLWEFDRDVRVNRDPGNTDQFEPTISVEDGNIYVAWTDKRENTSRIYFNMYNSTKNFWKSSDVKVNSSTYNSTKPSIAVKNGKIYLVWQQITDPEENYSGIFSSKSTDEGQSFSSALRIDEHNISLQPKIAVFNVNWAHYINKNWVHVVWTRDHSHENNNDTDVYFDYSKDEGETFEGNTRIDTLISSGGFNDSDDFSPSIAVQGSCGNPPTVFLSWVNRVISEDANIYFKKGDFDDFYYFLDQNFMEITDNSYSSILRTSIAADFDGNIHVVFDGSNDGDYHIYYSSSSDSGESFSNEISVSNSTSNSQYPVVGAPIKGGPPMIRGTYVGWQENKTSDYDIYMNHNRSSHALTSNPSDADTDDDGLIDSYEIDIVRTDPLNSDSDYDGILDGTEIGLASPQSGYSADTFQADEDTITTTNPLHRDTDRDGLYDGYEDLNHNRKRDDYEPGEDLNSNGNATGEGETYPTDRDTDKDGLLDGYDENWDGNSTISVIETDPLDVDTDDDGLWDGYNRIYNGTFYFGEMSIKTNASDNDTDQDNLLDGTEIGLYYDSNSDSIMTDDEAYSLISTDVYGTNLSNFVSDEDPLNTTDPLDTDTDNDGIWDGFNDSNENGTCDPDESGEDRNCNGNARNEGETDAAHYDTDRDGLTDGYGENWDGDAYLEDGETNPLDVDTDDDGLWDGYARIYEGVLYIGELSINTTATENDTDQDGLQDGTEIGLYYNQTSDSILTDSEANTLISPDVSGTNLNNFTSDEDHFNTTKPLIQDTDGDGLPDGWIDSNEDGYPQPLEGEDFNCNGKVDTCNISTGGEIQETIPHRLDSDMDGLNDTREVMNNTFWFEAEFNMITGATKVDNDTASTGVNITIPNPSVPEGSYMFYVKAKTIVEDTQLTFGVYDTPSTAINNKTVTLTDEYLWYNTTALNITNSDLPVYLYAPHPNANANIYIEKVMLVRISDDLGYKPIVTNASNSSVEFEEAGNQTIYIDIPENMYAKIAQMGLTGIETSSYATNSTLNVGNDTDIEWHHPGKFFGNESVPDFADEINEYIFNHQANFTNGSLSVPLTFYSNSSGQINISSLYIELAPDVYCPMDNDTDDDKLLEVFEKDHYYTHSLSVDSDNDMLRDYEEIMGTDEAHRVGTHPAHHDTDNDGLWDGFEDINHNGLFDIIEEVGEDINLNYYVDINETHPLDPDTDNDALLDGVEFVPGVIWFEAENYSVGQIISDEKASFNFTVENCTGIELIDEDSFPSVPTGDYLLYVRAISNLTDVQDMEYFSSGMGDWDKNGSDSEVNADSGYLKVIGDDAKQVYANNTVLNVPSSGDYKIEFDYRYPSGTEMKRFLVWGVYEISKPDIEIWQSKDKLYANKDSIAFASLPNTIWHHFEIVSVQDDTFRIYLDGALVYNSTKVENGSYDIFGKVGDTANDFTGTGNWDNIALAEASHINVTVRTSSSGVIWKIYPVFEEYQWYFTSPFTIGGDGNFEVDINDSDSSEATAYVDKIMLVKITEPSALEVTSTSDADEIIEFSGNENITVYLDLKVKDTVPLYVVRAMMDITAQANGGTYPYYPYLNIGAYENISIPKANQSVEEFANCSLESLENMTLPQWAWYYGEFTPQNGTQRLLDFSGELNRYIKDHINEPGMVNESGYLSIPLEFHSDTEGKLVLSNILIVLAPYATDALSNDTDGDGLLDWDEDFLWTYSLKWDSDNDGLYDVIEPVEGIGTDPLDSDSENDLLMDGNSDELRVIFRAGAVSGQFTWYNESTWIAIQNLIWIGDLGKYAPTAEDSTSRLTGYGYIGSESSLPASTSEIVFNTTEDYQLCYHNDTGNIYVKVGEGDYRIYNISDGNASYALNLTQPQVNYALNGQEVYANAALTADKDDDGMIDGIEYALGLSTTDADCDDDGLLDGIEYYLLGTDPNCNDTDGDFIQDGTEMGLTLDDVFAVKWNLETNILVWGTNLSRFVPDSDPVTTTNPRNTDSDNDGIWDGFKDTIQNNKPDDTESGEDRNCNGKAEGENETDAANPDTDGDGLLDGYDENWNGDAHLDDGETDPLDVDTDDDGLWDGYTVMLNGSTYLGELSLGTKPRSNDTDGDGIQDGTEVGLYYNSSNPSEDNILDNSEAFAVWANLTGTNVSFFVSDKDTLNTTDPLEVDSDGDGLDDGKEDENYDGWFENDYHETDPLNKDTDFDGLWDGVEDEDKDGFFDEETDETDPNDCDTDDDGIADGDERNWDQDTDDDDPLINALDDDSDDDGIIDGVEVGITSENKTVGGYGYNGTEGTYNGDIDPENTTDPLIPDTDGDGLLDGQEDENHNGLFENDKAETDPLNKDTDFDGLWDGTEDFNCNGDFETGELNPNDCDTDDDGIQDGHEKDWDGNADDDDLINALDDDSDGDEIIDGVEAGVTTENKAQGGYGYHGTAETYIGDSDPGNTTDPLNPDTDGDSLLDGKEDENHNGLFENDKAETDPNNKDTDFDGLSDGEEDCNNDGFFDSDGGDNIFGTADDELNPNDCDTDDDGIKDGWEIDWNIDTDEDGLINALDSDSDNDNVTDGVESGVATEDAPDEGYGYNGTADSYWGDNDTSTTTDPLNPDSDGDGIPDGWIDGWTYTRTQGWHQDVNKQNYNGSKEIWEGEDLDLDGAYEPDTDSKSETDPNSKDSDGDGIPDGFEVALCAINLDWSFGLNPLNASDAYEDLDNDTLTNLEEYEKGVNSNDLDIDFDNDDNLNFYDDNDDSDPWATIDEIYWGLDPYLNECSNDYDFDNDGLGNLYEWDNRDYINLTTADSDGDGLEDGWEYDYWTINRSQTENWALVNCSKYDSDGDNVNDGQELNGYQVTISWYEGEDLKSKDLKVYGDPMGAYKDQEDNYLDVDGDGIFDIDEVDPVNSTNLDWYFEVLKHDPRPQSEKDEQVQSQFNPFIKENIPPKIENIDIKTSAKTRKEKLLLVEVEIIEHCYTRIRAEISDVSEFTVKVKVKDNGKSVTFTGQGNEVFEANIDIDYWTDYLLNYRVKVTAEDVSGNEVEWEKKVNGVFGGLLDALAAIWDAIAGAFKAAFELMAKALNFLVELIKGIITSLLNPIFSKIDNQINAVMSKITEITLATSSELQKTNPVPEYHNREVVSFLLALLWTTPFILFFSLGLALLTLEAVLKPFVPIIAGIGIIIFGAIVGYLIVKIGSSKVHQDGPESEDVDESQEIIDLIPEEVWWAANAPLVITTYLSTAMSVLLGSKTLQPSTAVGMALAIFGFLFYLGSFFVIKAGLNEGRPWLPYLSVAIGLLLGISGLYLVTTDPLVANYPLCWSIFAAIALISFSSAFVTIAILV